MGLKLLARGIITKKDFMQMGILYFDYTTRHKRSTEQEAMALMNRRLDGSLPLRTPTSTNMHRQLAHKSVGHPSCEWADFATTALCPASTFLGYHSRSIWFIFMSAVTE